MRYYKLIDNGYLISVGSGAGGNEITESEYSHLLDVIRAAPAAPDGYQYKLHSDTLEWELAELPPAHPEEDTEATAEEIAAAIKEALS